MGKFVFKKFMGIILTVFLIIQPSIVKAITDNNDCSLSITHKHKEKILDNVEFRLFKVANLSFDNKFIVDDKFENYPIDLSKINDNSQWNALADTLESYIKVDKIKEDYKSITNNDGVVTFSNLNKGLYLVIGKHSSTDNTIIKTKPFLVSLPSKDPITNEYIYNVSSITKNDLFEYIEADVTVQKVWKNEKDITQRPKAITVKLYKDDVIFDTVELSEENQWKYVWSNLNKNHDWIAIESDVDDDYNVIYEKYDGKIIITNTHKESVLSSDDDNKLDDDSQVDKLPQTGVLWWPVPILALLGMSLIFIGNLGTRKNDD
ncbi:MAG: Cna B-type domain-containing protein [Peptostreptococcaceae bacterium]